MYNTCSFCNACIICDVHVICTILVVFVMHVLGDVQVTCITVRLLFLASYLI